MSVDPVACELWAGGFGGAVGVLIGQPFDFVKVRLQALGKAYTGPVDCLRQTVRREGVLGLYRGSIPPVLNSFVLNAVVFAGYSHGRVVVRPLGTSEDVQTFLAGSYAGLLSVGALVPFDLVKCQMQVDRATGKGVYANGWDCVRHVLRTEGIRGLYRGLLVTVVRDSPSTGLYFLLFESVERGLPSVSSAFGGDRATFLAGGIAGVVTWAMSYPFDTIKTYIQSAPVTVPAGHRDPFLIARYLRAQHGVGFFYRGLGTCLLRAFPVNAVTFVVYKRVKELMSQA